MEKAKKQIEEIINSMTKYFKDNTKLKLGYMECRNELARFLDKNGYLLYQDINNSTRVKNKDQVQYYIGLFIKEHKNKDDSIYKSLINIIEGSLIANALYINIENDNKSNLKNLVCYFDTPFMLRVLEFKNPSDNESAIELVELLKEQKAKIKCFSHNYSEIENILEEFIRNFGKPQEKTLENLIIKNYNETELKGILNSLKDLFDNLEIEIVDIPEYKKEEYKNVIDEKKLTENLEKLYPDYKKNVRIIENDVSSISAIMRLRKGKEYRKIEECPAIFVTTNKDIRRETNNLLKLDETFKISPVISDIDLTAILWLKSLSNHKDIPEMKLTENALAAIKPTISIKNKFDESVRKLQSNKIQFTTAQLHNLLCSNYFSEKLMDEIDGDINRINPNMVLNIYEETLKDNKIIHSEGKVLQEENDKLVQKLMEKEQADKKYKDNIYLKYEKKEEKIESIIRILERAFVLLLCSILCYVTIKYTFITKTESKIINIILLIVSLYSIICSIFPFSIFSVSSFIFKALNSQLFMYINKCTNDKAEKEIEEIFNSN